MNGIQGDKELKPRKKYERKKPKQVIYVPFGKYMINKRMLNDGYVLLKYPTHHGPITGFPKTKISETLSSLIRDILDTGQINIQTQKQLSYDMAEFFDRLINKCALVKALKYEPRTRTIADYVNRFEVLRGALISGLDESPEVKKELIEIIHVLSNPLVNKITSDDAIEMICELE